MLSQSRWCIHLLKDSTVICIEDAWPQIGYYKPGIYEVIAVGKCTARKMRNVRSIPQCEVPPGTGGCRKFEPPIPGEPVFEYNPAGRLWMHYLGPLSDSKAKGEAARIEGDKVRSNSLGSGAL